MWRDRRETVKVVINACFGGFSLSPRAVKAYADRKGWPCFFYKRGKDIHELIRITDEEAFAENDLFGPTAYRVPTVAELPPSQIAWADMSFEDRRASNEAWSAATISDREIPRDDADLVAVVEELGSAADGRCAKLRIVEVPDDVKWEIDEYDGSEHVAEIHRTWS
jgi:hypothetical protein